MFVFVFFFSSLGPALIATRYLVPGMLHGHPVYLAQTDALYLGHTQGDKIFRRIEHIAGNILISYCGKIPTPRRL